ncbi:DUF5131 family protein [Desulfofalx alkaliphila]|uniref:DUF5131 family protein n=1 Tax=Desulfofalx alkaliphila TaxID=105483 RepID=UPI0004E1481D|nr:phage Gp37/Gp68 family protein [Desulfofalx alkaliphila]
MSKTKIEWADAVWNPVTGCTPISPGCENCYAKRMAQRLRGRCGYPADEPFRVTMHLKRFIEPLRWKKPRRVFVCSMGDLFHENVPDNIIYNIFAVMADTPQHTYMVLTKRPGRMKDILCRPNAANEIWRNTTYSDDPGCHKYWPLPNVWLGVTAENQEQADKRIPILLQIPATVRFVSVEPMLGPVDLSKYLTCQFYAGEEMEWRKGTIVPEGYPKLRAARIRSRIDWVICGGESGPLARPMHPDWVRSLRDQCVASGVPFFFKQWGEWAPVHELRCNEPGIKNKLWYNFDPDTSVCKIGKKKAGRLLDSREWDEFPGHAG